MSTLQDNTATRRFIGCEVTEEIYNTLTERARKTNRSRSGFIRHAIENTLVEDPAKARLIAVSRELLDALEGVTNSYTALVASCHAEFGDPESDAAVKAARVAIANAKGGAL
jgi:predicted transcriptional regulator